MIGILSGPRWGETFWQRAGVASTIEVRIGNVIDVLSELEHSEGPGSFDLIFIDADKANYENHYEASLHLVRVGGLIILDNMLHLGRVPDSDHNDPGTVAVRALNRKIVHDERVDRVILLIGDGVTLVRRRSRQMSSGRDQGRDQGVTWPDEPKVRPRKAWHLKGALTRDGWPTVVARGRGWTHVD